MNAPARAPIAEPGEFPDPEILLADILAAVEVNGAELGVGQVDTDVSGLNAPCIHCYIPPGRRQLGRYGDMDSSFVYVGTWSDDRRTSQEMLKGVRRLLEPLRDGGMHKGVQIHRVRESTGPAQLPQQPDTPDQLVESGWTIDLRRHGGEAVYS